MRGMIEDNCVNLGFGQGFLRMMLEEGAVVVAEEELAAAPAGEIELSLDSPLGKKLEDFSGCRSASILASDITRPSPTHLLLPPLVRRLKSLGIDDLRIVFGLGTHRRMTEEEVRRLLKGCIRIPHMQHDLRKCTLLGETSRGTPVEINQTVASSDLIIATGNIEYHYYAGYSGGAKAVLPGISSERSVIRNHELMRDPLSATGRLDSPVRLDMEDAAGVAGLDFILNVVLNGRNEIVQAVAGDYIHERLSRRRSLSPALAAGPRTSIYSRLKRPWTMPKTQPSPAAASSWWPSAARGWAILFSSAGPGRRARRSSAGIGSEGSMSSEGIRPPSWLKNLWSIISYWYLPCPRSGRRCAFSPPPGPCRRPWGWHGPGRGGTPG
ncbi:MAG: hypothetical protein H6R31_412 [Methanomicrobia archaeon]|nr:hypothetical protein [Methanomicrobia archaeon]